jgi:hypothetical protein
MTEYAKVLLKIQYQGREQDARLREGVGCGEIEIAGWSDKLVGGGGKIQH